MDGQEPEETQDQAPAAEAPQPPEEVKYQVMDTSLASEEMQGQIPVTEAPQAPEEVRPQVIGAPQPLEERASGMAIGAMVVGIVGILCAWAIVFSLPLGITALVLGIIEFKRIKDGASHEKGRGMALTGIILGSLALFTVVTYIVVIAFTAVSFATGMLAWLPSVIKQFGTFY